MTTSQAGPVALEEATARPAKLGRDPIKHKRAILGFLAPVGVLFALFYLVPVGYAVYQSFLKIQREGAWGAPETVFGGFAQYKPVLESNGLWFSSPFRLLANIGDVLTYQNGLFLRWLVNSLLYAGGGAFLATLFASMAGYALSKYVFPGREVFFNTVLGGVLVPATALALPLFLLFSRMQIVDTFWAVFLPSIVSPFGVYLARIYAAASVPEELLEASRLDGAGEFRTFFGLATRLMAPALVTIFLFQFVAIWNNFFLPLVMLQNERLYPITLGLYTWNSTVTPITGAAHLCHRRRLALHCAADHRLRVPAAVLAKRPGRRRRQVTRGLPPNPFPFAREQGHRGRLVW